MTKSGITVIDDGAIRDLREDQRMAAIRSDDEAIRVAMKHNAEIVVTGEVSVRWTSMNDLGHGEHHATLELLGRAIDTSNGELIATLRAHGTTPATIFDETTLRITGANTLGELATKQLLEGITRAWTNENARRYTVQLVDAHDYAEQVLPFVRVVQRVPGVELVANPRWAASKDGTSGWYEMEVRYSRFFDATRLTTSIITSGRRLPALARLNLGSALERRSLTFTIGRATKQASGATR